MLLTNTLDRDDIVFRDPVNTIENYKSIFCAFQSRFDGTSEYKLDKDGKIPSTICGAADSIGCPSTPKATYFESSYWPVSEDSTVEHHCPKPEA